jgi:hypothetical protein
LLQRHFLLQYQRLRGGAEGIQTADRIASE